MVELLLNLQLSFYPFSRFSNKGNFLFFFQEQQNLLMLKALLNYHVHRSKRAQVTT